MKKSIPKYRIVEKASLKGVYTVFHVEKSNESFISAVKFFDIRFWRVRFVYWTPICVDGSTLNYSTKEDEKAIFGSLESAKEFIEFISKYPIIHDID